MVFHLGGGSFDVSIINNRLNRVLATNGDSHMGGQDFDNILVEYARNKL